MTEAQLIQAIDREMTSRGEVHRGIDLPRVTTFKHQSEFLFSPATHAGLVAGFGGGKSKIATIKTVSHLKRFPTTGAAYYLPTYSLVKDIAFPNFLEHLAELGIPHELNETAKVMKTPLGDIKFRSLEDPSKIVGFEVGYSIVDEADIPPTDKMRDAMVKIVGRNRKPLIDRNGIIHTNCLDFVSTPEGFGFMYEFFVKNKKANRHLIQAKSRDNTFLPPSFFETLEEMYTAEQLAAYLDGQFVNLKSGNVYHHFDRVLNATDRTARPGEMLHIGMDFNVTNMNAVLFADEGQKVYAVDEFVGLYDTAAMIDAILTKYPGRRLAVYPDASGQNKSTNSGLSDTDLLKKAGFIVRVNSKNPFVKDRVNAMNQSFRDNKGARYQFVNPNTCPEYASALEQIGYKNGVPDKTSGLDHITEAGGYFVSSKFQNKWIRVIAPSKN